MTEEEKQAIEDLNLIKETIDKQYFKTRNSHTIEIIKNLIEKQSKEIERQKEINKEHQELNGKLQTYIKELEEKVEKYKSTWD